MDAFTVLDKQYVNGRFYVYVKNNVSGFYGWYELNDVESPPELKRSTIEEEYYEN